MSRSVAELLVPFHALGQRQLAEVVAIYEEAFAAPWEWPVERVSGLADAPDGPVWTLAALDGGAAAAFIICEYLPGGQVWHVHYLAVRPDLRGQRWGGRLLSAALPYGEEAARRHGHGGSLGTLLEIEAVDGPPPGADREQRVRRQRFYQALGALLTGPRYPRPPWAPPEMPDFDIVFIPGSAWDGRVDEALLHRFLRAVAVEGYQVPPDAPWLLAALQQLAPSEP
jgi:ribosomal protein S18 acetylase RimI-like enzyme